MAQAMNSIYKNENLGKYNMEIKVHFKPSHILTYFFSMWKDECVKHHKNYYISLVAKYQVTQYIIYHLMEFLNLTYTQDEDTEAYIRN